MNRFTLLLLFLLNSLMGSAQLSKDTLPRPAEKHHRYVLNLDNRNSFILKDAVSLYGFKAGISIGNKWRAGLGYYNILFPINLRYSLQGIPYDLRISFWYGTCYLEYVIVHRNKWEISAPLVFGIGPVSAEKLDGRNVSLSASQRPVSLMEVSVNGYYKVFNWIGPGLGLGYRQMLENSSVINKNFNAPIYIFRVQIFLDPLYHDLFPHGIHLRRKQTPVSEPGK